MFELVRYCLAFTAPESPSCFCSTAYHYFPHRGQNEYQFIIANKKSPQEKNTMICWEYLQKKNLLRENPLRPAPLPEYPLTALVIIIN
jgi:hypothetical protein